MPVDAGGGMRPAVEGGVPADAGGRVRPEVEAGVPVEVGAVAVVEGGGATADVAGGVVVELGDVAGARPAGALPQPASSSAISRGSARRGTPATLAQRSARDTCPVYTVFTPSHRGGEGPPLVCLHGFMDTWRTWELVLPMLEREHDVLAPTFVGHAGGPPLDRPVSADLLPDAIERAMDEAGFDTAHIAGSSLGGFVALQLAARGRARSVVALAPAGGWAKGDESFRETLAMQATMHEQLKAAAPHAQGLVATLEGRRQATRLLTTSFEHIPAELLAHLTLGVASCTGARAMIDFGLEQDAYGLDAEPIACPVRIVWGTADAILPWPSAAAAFRGDRPQADWVQLEGVGHYPQLDVPLETAQLILGVTGR